MSGCEGWIRLASLLLAGVRLDGNCELSCSIKTHYWLLLASAVFFGCVTTWYTIYGNLADCDDLTPGADLADAIWWYRKLTSNFIDHFHTIHPSDTL